MKKIKIYKLSIVLLIAGLVQQGCTNGFESMNRDWQNPTQATIPTMMNYVLSTFELGWQEQNAIHNGYYYAVTQQLANAAPRYVITQGETEIWNNYYSALRTIRALEKMLASNSSNLKADNISAMLKVCLAYKTLRTCDYFGDMHFTKAGYGKEGSSEYLRPVYDKEQDIYKACLDMLKEAANSFVDNTSDQIVSVGDPYNIFWNSAFVSKTDYTMWRKFANSIRLRYAMQISTVDASTAQSIIGEILGNPSAYPLLDSDSRDETAGLWPTRLSLTFDSRPWSFSAENLTCLGSVMWKEMTDLAVPTVGTTATADDGVSDPQFYDPRGYLFFETNNNNKWLPQMQFNAPFTQSRGGYFTGTYPSGRNHAQTDQEWNNKQNAYYSSVNYYLVRDDNSYPELMITDAEVNFIKAEAYTRGVGVSKDLAKAKTCYENGIKASMRTWFSFYTLINSSTYKWVMYPPHVPTAAEITDYINRTGISFSSNENTALKQIYKQIWIDSFRQPWVAFNLIRRVGADMLPHESGLTNEFETFYRIPYPETEIINNAANYTSALGGRENTPQSKKLFWQK